MRDSVLQAIYEAIDEVNRTLPEEDRLRQAEDTILFGDSGHLDSMAAVNLLLISEERLASQFGRLVNLTETVMLDESQGPPATVSALRDRVVGLLGEAP